MRRALAEKLQYSNTVRKRVSMKTPESYDTIQPS